jgi:hypothetical protein
MISHTAILTARLHQLFAGLGMCFTSHPGEDSPCRAPARRNTVRPNEGYTNRRPSSAVFSCPFYDESIETKAMLLSYFALWIKSFSIERSST